MKRILILIVMAVVLSGCCTSFCDSLCGLFGCGSRGTEAYRNNRINPDDIAHVVIFNAAEFRHKHNLRLEQSYTYTCRGEQHLTLMFTSMDSVEMHEGREILVAVVERTLEKINSDPAIQAQMWMPFELKDLEV